MRFLKDLGFAKIYRNQKIDSYLSKIFVNAYNNNKKIFKRTPRKFKIVVCDTESEFKRESRYYYQKWATATVLRDLTLVARSPAFVEKIGMWKRNQFANIINHEMCHIFWQSFYNLSKPCWLDEGLACYVGRGFIMSKNNVKKIIKEHKINCSILDYRYLKRNFTKGHYPRYPIWANFTRYIIKKHSLSKIIKFMDNYSKDPTKKNYLKLLRNLFGKTEKQMFKEFLLS